MGIDLSKLMPAPWYASDTLDNGMNWAVVSGDNEYIARTGRTRFPQPTAEFIALARNAFDVMMRRGWGVERYVAPDGSLRWSVEDESKEVGGVSFPTVLDGPDPFTAIVEADKWYREHIEKAGA